MLTRHFHYLADRIGINRVAIGSDLDGAAIPAAIKDASGLPNLTIALRASGFDEESMGKIAFDNWMRVFRLTWRAMSLDASSFGANSADTGGLQGFPGAFG
jgi:membrane dipeptidase